MGSKRGNNGKASGFGDVPKGTGSQKRQRLGATAGRGVCALQRCALGSLAFSYFGQAKVHRLGQGSASFTFDGYLDGPFNVVDLAAQDRKQPFWRHTFSEQSSSQFRNELNLVYRFKDKLSVVAGGDFRNGLVQSDYARSSNCVEEASPFEGMTPADAGELVDGVGNFH